MPIQTAQYKIRHLRRHEIEQLLQLCKAEGRHMGTVTEVETWMQIDPQGFFVAVNHEGKSIHPSIPVPPPATNPFAAWRQTLEPAAAERYH